MANSKISALTSATTVAGSEVLPIVQSSATVKVSVANLTPGLGTITAAKGGTGQTSYAVGDLLYADTTTTLAKLADVATGNALISGGLSTAPSWGKISLTTHVSGILPVANGGTNASSASITAFNNITGYSASGATGTTTTNLVFSTSPTITTPSITGDATLTTGNVVVSNGKGIDFSATPGTGTSELFADYEEGTWTAAFVCGTSGTITISNSYKTGTYIKVGKQVTVTGYLQVSSVSSPVGVLSISGLPYAIVNSTQNRAGCVAYAEGLSATAVTAIQALFPEYAASTIIISKFGTGLSSALAGDVVASSSFSISGTYFTT